MAMVEKKDDAQDRGAKGTLIEWVTENGFSIVRSCAVDGSSTEREYEYRFLVRNPNGWEREVVVEFERAAVMLIRRSGRNPLPGSFWVNCAERSLATYLWEKDEYPANGRLTLQELCLDDLEAARRCDS